MYNIPKHLPKKLTICYWGWDWITFATPGEAWDDIDKAMKESKERGFNCVRAEIGPDWMYTNDLALRGPIEFITSVKGGLKNCHCINEKGGGRHDVYQRVIKLFESAEKNDMYVIPTTWEYQDSNNHLGDEALRQEINSVPTEKRLLSLAVKNDCFLNDLKKKGLEKRIAYFEIYNEINCDYHEFSKPLLKSITEDACAYLRARHPDILICADYAFFDPETFADNSQVVDHHRYTKYIMQEAFKEAGIRQDNFPDLENNSFLKWIFKKDFESWNDFSNRASRLKKDWWPTCYFYENLNNEKYDFWCLKLFGDRIEKIVEELKSPLVSAAKFAKERNLPVVIDEGYIFFPPYHSRFEQSAAGRYISEAVCDICIENDYWGYYLSGYTRPNTIAWHDEYHCEKLRAINEKFINGRQDVQAFSCDC